ncbi:type II and III secretion system protein family protein [Aquabacterium sp. NJ1]|uniref:type II and III secretion system protein family protein n=1 Tax=Aquabacterium sp. NJ1 TaxID=1538295 RepID=UPI0009DE3380|nr:type II and III secretion system protein family protein [Aquabacterium sp. NJ1]
MSQSNRPLTLARSTLSWAAALTCCLATSQAMAANASCSRVDIAPVVKVALGKSTIIRPQAPIQRIVLGSAPAPANAAAANPAGAPRLGAADVDVMLLSPSEVYLLGKSLGTTNVVLMDRSNVCTAFDVLVSMDALGLQTLIRDLVPDEKNVKVTTANDAIVLSGEVSDSEAVNRVVDLAQAFVGGGSASGAGSTNNRNAKVINMLSVGAPQQVMLEVKVAEISKTLLDEFGVDFSRYQNSSGNSIQLLSNLLSVSPGGNLGGSIAFSRARSKYTTSVLINAQKNDELIKVLAEPTIMAISGQTGSFLAGGKVLIPVSQNNSSGGTNITLEEKEFGVAVSFTPTVLGGGRINLHVRPEVSELNASGVTIAGLNGNAVLPSFTSRKAETTVQLADGQSFAIGGLVKNNATTNISAFPFLGELPVIGALFRSSQFQTNRTELVFVITPRLVKSLPADYKLPTDNYVPPSRSDVILNGRTEGSKPDGDAAGSAPAPAPSRQPASNGGFDLSTPKDKP